jgi:hypothetical protein
LTEFISVLEKKKTARERSYDSWDGYLEIASDADRSCNLVILIFCIFYEISLMMKTYPKTPNPKIAD